MASVPIACILLAGGNSTRFGGAIPKQWVKNKQSSAVEQTIKTARGAHLSPIILVIQSAHIPFLCQQQLSDIRVVINDVTDNRMESIRVGLDVAVSVGSERCIIHDVARPFVTVREFALLISQVPRWVVYAQYYMRIMGGLVHVGDGSDVPHFCNPAEYREVVTPLMISVKVACNIYATGGQAPIYEFYPFLSEEQKRTCCQWFEGSPARLRKITYFDDII